MIEFDSLLRGERTNNMCHDEVTLANLYNASDGADMRARNALQQIKQLRTVLIEGLILAGLKQKDVAVLFGISNQRLTRLRRNQ